MHDGNWQADIYKSSIKNFYHRKFNHDTNNLESTIDDGHKNLGGFSYSFYCVPLVLIAWVDMRALNMNSIYYLSWSALCDSLYKRNDTTDGKIV